jgi:hypothetical protein
MALVTKKIVDNSPCSTVTTHQRICFRCKRAAACLTEAQRRKYRDGIPSLENSDYRYIADARSIAADQPPAKIGFNGHHKGVPVIFIRTRHGLLSIQFPFRVSRIPDIAVSRARIIANSVSVARDNPICTLSSVWIDLRLLDNELPDPNTSRPQGVVNTVERYAAAFDQQIYVALLFDRNKASFKRLHPGKDNQDNDRRTNGCGVHSATDCQTDSYDRPETRGGRQSTHDLSAQQYRPCSQETDAGHHLGGYPGRIEHNVLLPEHIGKSERGDEHD